MRRMGPILVVLVTGCSTAPIADFMDHFMPAKINPQPLPGARTRGGVCEPGQQDPSLPAGNPANTPQNPAVSAVPGGVPTLPPAGAAPGATNELPPVTPPTVPGGMQRYY